MPSCVVKWCRSHTDQSKSSGLTFHVFPQDPRRRDLWTKAVQLERQENDWMPSKISRICSIHFKEEEYFLSKKGYHMLLKSAVPFCTMVRSSEKSHKSKSDAQLPSRHNKDVPGISSPQKRRLVSCPNCGHDFGIAAHLNEGDSNLTRDHRQLTSPVTGADRNTPLNILSSDIESAFNTPKTQKIKQYLSFAVIKYRIYVKLFEFGFF